MPQQLSAREIIMIGFMLFALFLGAGNMIFPPALGQAAGDLVIVAVLGFLITGVGLPLLGITAVALKGGDLESISSRVHPLFGIIFSAIIYLAIGPFFGIPRTGTVAFEIGAYPFLPTDLQAQSWPLVVYTLAFFGVTYWLALTPSKLVDRIGKWLTPTLFIILLLLISKAIIAPLGEIGTAVPDYKEDPFFKGFIEGYLTMDAIGALAFGIVILQAVKSKGITEKKTIRTITIQAGMIAAIGLSFVYVSLAYIGATSIDSIGVKANGGILLSAASEVLYGSIGMILLAVMITFACLTTAVGLVSAVGEFFHKLVPAISYRTMIGILTIFSLTMANVGLNGLITVSLPVLLTIYPIAIALILLSFFDDFFAGRPETYIGGISATACISLFDGLSYAGIEIPVIPDLYDAILPFQENGVGWLVPFLVGSFIGYMIGLGRRKAVQDPNPTT